MIDADPLLARLAEHSYPNLHLRSTFAVSVATVLIAMATQNMVLAAMIGLLLLAGHVSVIFLLAHRDERGTAVLLRLLRGGCAVVIVLIVSAMLATPSGAATSSGPSRHASPTLSETDASSSADPAPEDPAPEDSAPRGQGASGTP